MNALQILFVLVYLSLLIAYFFSETSGNFKRRAVNKIVMASLFMLLGGYWFFEKGYAAGWGYIALIALFFSWLGDVLLLWSFVRGGVSFSIGNLLFIAYLILSMRESGVGLGNIWWCLLLFALLLFVILLCLKKKWISFGSMTPVLVGYMTSTTGHGCLGLGLAFAAPSAHTLLLGLGLALFMISDYFLMAHRFKKSKRWILRLNSGTYFTGMMLVALSFSV